MARNGIQTPVAADSGKGERHRLAIEYRPLAALIPYARNSRVHTDSQIKAIAESIRRFGIMRPVLIDGDGGIIAGHGLVLALQLLGASEAPCIAHTHLSDEARRAYIIVDNRLAELSSWNDDMLRLEIGDLSNMGFDVGSLGFTDADLNRLMSTNGASEAANAPAPAPPVNPRSKPGDVWLLGRHRLLCGDCTNPNDVERALNGVVPLLMVTDPPYGVDYKPEWRNEKLGQGKRATGTVKHDDRVDWSKAWALFPGDVAYVWHSGLYSSDVEISLRAADFQTRAQIIWAKPHFAIGRGDYHWQHEGCWYAVRKGKTGHYIGDRKQSTVWNIDTHATGYDGKSEQMTGHGTQKPVECMLRPINNNSAIGQPVFDPFMGSGTTIIAAEISGRAAIGLEIDPAYVDVAVMRWQDFTGKKAVNEATKRPFDETAAPAVLEAKPLPAEPSQG